MGYKPNEARTSFERCERPLTTKGEGSETCGESYIRCMAQRIYPCYGHRIPTNLNLRFVSHQLLHHSDSCDSLYYMVQADSDGVTCRLCPDGVDCDSVGNELANLMIKPGFFRATPDSKKVYACTFDSDSKKVLACPGGNQTGDMLCSDGYEGPLCDRSVPESV